MNTLQSNNHTMLLANNRNIVLVSGMFPPFQRFNSSVLSEDTSLFEGFTEETKPLLVLKHMSLIH